MSDDAASSLSVAPRCRSPLRKDPESGFHGAEYGGGGVLVLRVFFVNVPDSVHDPEESQNGGPSNHLQNAK